MSITYEEALSTLEAMFAAPWNRELLDAVLRHEKGHMENTCDRILNHGDQDPQILVDRLKAGGAEPQVAMDEELARQLAAGGSSSRGGGGGGGGGSSQRATNKKKGRGTPTSLPDDFLRIPGYKRTAAAAASAASATGGAIDDETLARMLQDELFSEELARNPDFAHLARGGAGRGAGRRSRVPPAARRPGSAQAAGPPQPNPFEGTMEKLSAMGMGARSRLAMFAKNFEQKMQTLGNPDGPKEGHLQENAGAAAERRGLLDDDGDEEDVIEFEMKKKM